MEVKMRYTIILTPTAKSDIVNLKLSLKQRFIDTAFIQKELSQIYQKICSLSIFPERYPIVDSKEKYRKLSYKKYLILYKVIGNYIYIFYIRPSRMNILQELQDKQKSRLSPTFLMYFYAFMLLFIEYAIYVDGVKNSF